jgi:outer membrane protein assembly factor BamB
MSGLLPTVEGGIVNGVQSSGWLWLSRLAVVGALILGPDLLPSMPKGSVASAEDWPQWMGPRRDGTWNETGLVSQIPPDGLPIRWRVPVGGGYSGPAVVDGRVFLTDYKLAEGRVVNDPGSRIDLKGQERILCFSADKGELLWEYAYDCPYKISYPAGPRTTPAVHDGRVIALGAEGRLVCLTAQTGKLIWEKQLNDISNVDSPLWGHSGHPLIDGEMVIVPVGGTDTGVMAFQLATGEEIWRSLSTPVATYCPPSIILSGGQRQLVLWDPEQIHGLNPATGQVLWSQPLKPNYEMSIMMPRLAGNRLYAGGIGRVGALFQLKSNEPGIEKVVWTGQAKSAIYAANATPIVDGDMLYGADCETGLLTAARLSDGQRAWETAEATTGTRRGGHGTAFLVKNGDKYWIFSETGALILAELTPAKYRELGRMKILEPTGECFGRSVVWSHPAFADRHCFARNDTELVCVSLAE